MSSLSQKLQDALNESDFNPQKLMDVLKENPFLKEQFQGDVGVWGGLALEQHTLMVLRQFEKYFKDQVLPGNIDRSFFRLLLGIHDIGKPLALLAGDKWLQHKNTKLIIYNIRRILPLTDQEIDRMIAVLDGDPIGSYYRDRYNLEQSMEELQRMANAAQMRLDIFFDLLTIYFQVDAGAYTQDAGGKAVLDHLFEIDSTRGMYFFNKQEGRIQFSQTALEKFRKLENGIKQLISD